MAVASHEAGALELIHASRDRLSRRRDHVSEQAMSERELEPNAVGTDSSELLRQLQELLTQSIDVTAVAKVARRVLAKAERARQVPKECDGRLAYRQELFERSTWNHGDPAVRERM